MKSINRTTVIIVLAVFLSISIGYALFSDTITIEGTATAKGEFNLTTTCTTGIASDFSSAMEFDEEEFGEKGYSNDSCIVDGNSVTMKVDFTQPGSLRFFTVKIKNTSSVDVVTEVDSDGFLTMDNLTTNLKVTNLTTGEVTEKNYTGYSFADDDYAKDFPFLALFLNAVKLENDTYLLDDDEYLENEVFYKDSSNKKYIKLSPNQTISIILYSIWSEDADVQGDTSETKATLPIEFKQLTTDMEVDTEADTCLFGC